MKHTSLYREHLELNGKIVDYYDWELPELYTSISDEHNAVRKKAAMFDLSYLGKISVRGRDAEKLLRKVIPTSLDFIENGQCIFTCFCNEYGGVIDAVFIYRTTDTEFYMVVNPYTIEKDMRWLHLHISGDVEVTNFSDKIAKIDVQGPISKQIINEVISEKNIDELEHLHFMQSVYDGQSVFISNNGYTGESGYEIFVPTSMASKIWRRFMEKGKFFGLVAAGLGARESLRLEACYPSYGRDLSEHISPVEAGFAWLINSKDNFVGKEILYEQKKTGSLRESICIGFSDRNFPPENSIVKKDNVEIGSITSSGFSYSLDKGIALAIVKRGSIKKGDSIKISLKDKTFNGIVVKKPFYSPFKK